MLQYRRMEENKRFTRNMKRIRSDSNGDIEDGIEDELEERYYRVTMHYIKSLMFSSVISRCIYVEMLTSGVIDKIVNRKRIDGIEKIYETSHEDSLCSRYVKKQRKNEVSTWVSFFTTEKRKKLKHKHVPCHMLCSDLVNLIKDFL